MSEVESNLVASSLCDGVDPKAPQGGRKRLSVLIVEDDADTRTAIEDVLREEGYEVSGVSNGADALEWLTSSPSPGLIILDLMMPALNGWQFLKEQRKRPALASLPVIVLSADRAARDRHALEATFVLSKPVALDALLSAVERVCKREGEP